MQNAREKQEQKRDQRLQQLDVCQTEERKKSRGQRTHQRVLDVVELLIVSRRKESEQRRPFKLHRNAVLL